LPHETCPQNLYRQDRSAEYLLNNGKLVAEDKDRKGPPKRRVFAVSCDQSYRTAVIFGSFMLLLSHHMKPVSMIFGIFSPLSALTAASTVL